MTAAIAPAHCLPLVRGHASGSGPLGMPAPSKTPPSALAPGRNTATGSSALDLVLAYHERTKHHFHRYAASLGYLDWATQPDPFRRYAGAEIIHLPHPPLGNPLPYWRLYEPGQIAPQSLSVDSVAHLFRYALSLTAWKQYQDSSWSLRANPSSGNLHPTEGYAVLPALPGLGGTPGVYHYAPREHALERRGVMRSDLWNQLLLQSASPSNSFTQASRLMRREGAPVPSRVEGASPLLANIEDSSCETGRPRPASDGNANCRATLPQSETGSFMIGLSSIHWREAWKYGERAFRYCQHDVGHALAALRFAAATLGWKLTLLTSAGDEVISSLLGLNRLQDFVEVELEEPDLLAIVRTSEDTGPPPSLPASAAIRDGIVWSGEANSLSPEHAADWPVIDAVSEAVQRRFGLRVHEPLSTFPQRHELFSELPCQSVLSAEKVILGRRSAVAMDGVTTLPAAVFLRMLARVLPLGDGSAMPWDAIPWRPRIHLLLFVHRVVGLPSGLYMLVRDTQKLAALQSDLRSDFVWQSPASVPAALPLYTLALGDYRDVAARLACGQEIAADGAFSLAMIADYKDSLDTYGPSFYRNLFWESGMVGQVLYLEAEDAGVRATGIGCYFDDPVHELLGLQSREWQSFYHFTVGGPVDDPRLTTLPPYPNVTTT